MSGIVHSFTSTFSLPARIRSLKRRAHSALSRVAPDLVNPKDPRTKVVFLHIGKNAGSQMQDVADQIAARSRTHRLIKLGHHKHLRSIPYDRPYIFSVRDPVSRFKSAFYSRKREGRPLYYSKWTDDEARAFADFEHANDLAEALFSSGAQGAAALGAIKSISHASMNQIDWFDRAGNFLALRPPLMILRQERFREDLQRFLDAIGFNEPISLSEKRRHGNDYDGVPPISERGRENLLRWYAPDAEFYRVCERWIEERRGD